jgi:intracellular multiplication protein IcmE
MTIFGNKPPDRRQEICRAAGLTGETELYQLVAGSKTSPEKLLAKGLNSKTLSELGYNQDGLRRIGYAEDALRRLGYLMPKQADEPARSAASVIDTADVHSNDPEHMRELVRSGYRAEQFRIQDISIQHLKRASCTPHELERCGYSMEDLLQVFSCAELRKAGYPVRELRRHFKGHELRNAGFSATDMRNAGFGIKDLLGFGYNENQVKTAGFSIQELGREGLNRLTVDKTKMQ